MTTFDHDPFQRPAQYWLRRADISRQAGDALRASLLERHAVRAEPDHAAACMNYAHSLRTLGCWEASCREAFAGLAQDPSRTALFGVVGQAFLDMGLTSEGLDAMDLYLMDPPAIPPVWQDEAYDRMDSMERKDPPRRQARMTGLLQIAARRVTMGDAQGAQRAIDRASRAKGGRSNPRRELISAMVLEQTGEREKAAEAVRRVMQMAPKDAQLLASAASLLETLGEKNTARAALLRAADCAETPAEQLAVCLVSDQLKAPSIACVMLRRMHRDLPSRAPVCHDLCACLLRLGRMEEALRYAHLCREIDPDDVPGELLFARVTAMQEMTPKEQRASARTVSYYGALSQAELSDCAAPVTALLQKGPEALAEAVLTDGRLRARLLYLVTMPSEWPAGLLAAIAPHMPKDDMIRLLREILLQHPRQTLAKQYALSMLGTLGVEPPYPMWQDGRIGWADPTRLPPESPTFRQRVITMRIRQAARLCRADKGIIPWAMHVVSRMDAQQRRAFIADPLRIWPAAIAMVYRKGADLPPLTLNLDTLDAVRFAALSNAIRMLDSLDPRGGSNE